MDDQTPPVTPDQGVPGVQRIDPRSTDVGLEPLTADHDTALAGLVQVSSVNDMAVGVWDHTIGTSTHTEEDEVFIVVSGSVIVTEDGSAPTRFGPGDIGILRSGARTTWEVTEPLRKVWVAREGPDD
jgi:uncharacterized cupin superfamily protein